MTLTVTGNRIAASDGKLLVPDRPAIPFIEGDGIGPDLWSPSQRVFDAAVHLAYGGRRQIEWFEVLAGEKGYKLTGSWLPDATLDAISEYLVAIKGPLDTPVGGGIRSLNVAIRQQLDLYACVRPIKYYPGVPCPVSKPHLVDMVVFRENTEDVYAGLEWAKDSEAADALIGFLNRELGVSLRTGSALGIKPISEYASKRLVRKAIEYALDKGRKSVTLVHKGNVMKYTEGAFARWGYDVARDDFGELTVTESDLEGSDSGRLVIKDRIADNMFQQVLLRPREYDVIATMNLNGDYLSDALAAQAGGLGMAPGANLGEHIAVFEATHGTAPKYAGLDKVNPCSIILSGVMMLEHMGWIEAAQLITASLQKTLVKGAVTYDLARQRSDATQVSTSRFCAVIVEEMERIEARNHG